MIASFFDFLFDGVFDFIGGFLGLFPEMPFSASDVSNLADMEMVETCLAWVNYFLPLDIAASVVALWGVAFMAYVGIKQALRFTGELM